MKCKKRGHVIAQHNGQVKRIDENFYTVLSQSGNGEYAVTKIDHEWICECPDNKYRHIECKHIHAIKFSQSLRAEVAVARIEPLSNLSNCIYCGSSNLKKKGIRKNKSGNIQKYECRTCHKNFLQRRFRAYEAQPSSGHYCDATVLFG